MKKKLLIVLGAGSSVEQGLPGVADLDRIVAEAASNRAARLHNQDFYDVLWRNRAAYHSDLMDEAKLLQEWRTAPNYERVLGDLQMLMNAALEKPFGDPMLQWLAKSALGVELNGRRNELVIQIEGQLSALLERIAERMRGGSHMFEFELTNGRGSAAFQPYRQLFAGLAGEFEIGVYNLNYDTVALNAMSEPFVGFNRNTGAFLPTEVLSRREWGFLYHLHGSIHNRIRESTRIQEDKDFGPKITWYEDFRERSGDNEEWCDVWNVTTKSDQKRVIFSTLVAGGWKLDQLQTEPFLTFYSTLQRHVYEADAILIGGYGFGDSHIDAALGNMLRSRANAAGRPPVLVLDFEKDRKSIAQRIDHWAFAMPKVLRVPKVTFRSPQTRSIAQWTEVPTRVGDGEFEQVVDRDHPAPVAIWNAGFKLASEKLPQILRWLNGHRGAL